MMMNFRDAVNALRPAKDGVGETENLCCFVIRMMNLDLIFSIV